MSKCDYCGNENDCRTCGLTYDDGVKDGKREAIDTLVKEMEKHDKCVPWDRLDRVALIYAIDVLERHHKEHSDDMTSSHSEEMIYKGCLNLMEKMVDYFHEYIDYIGYDFTVEDPDERFLVSFMPTEIVRTLFLSGTGHDGGTSCRMKCQELGIEADKPLKFNFCQEGTEE